MILFKIVVAINCILGGALSAGTYKLIPAQSILRWEGGKQLVVTNKHAGTVKIKSAIAEIDGENLRSARFVVDMTSFVDDDKTPKLIKHLKSDDFFSVGKYPIATLNLNKSKKISKDTFALSGDLTMRGKTLPIHFEAKIKNSKKKIVATSSFTIDRTKWGVIYGSNKGLVNGVLDRIIKKDIKFDVKLALAEVAVKPAAKSSARVSAKKRTQKAIDNQQATKVKE